MTEEESAAPEVSAHVSAISSFDNDEEALEALVQLKELDFGRLFTNRDTQLDSDEGQGISITLYHDEKSHFLALRTKEESNINITLSLSNDVIGEIPEVLNKILPHVGSITHKDTVVYKKFDKTFESLDLPLEEDRNLNIVGIRISQGKMNYIIQEDDDDDGIEVTMIKEFEKKFVDDVPDDFAIKEVEDTTRFIEEEL